MFRQSTLHRLNTRRYILEHFFVLTLTLFVPNEQLSTQTPPKSTHRPSLYSQGGTAKFGSSSDSKQLSKNKNPISTAKQPREMPPCSLGCFIFFENKSRKNTKNALQIFPVRCFIFKQLFLMFKKEERGQ